MKTRLKSYQMWGSTTKRWLTVRSEKPETDGLVWRPYIPFLYQSNCSNLLQANVWLNCNIVFYYCCISSGWIFTQDALLFTEPLYWRLRRSQLLHEQNLFRVQTQKVQYLSSFIQPVLSVKSMCMHHAHSKILLQRVKIYTSPWTLISLVIWLLLSQQRKMQFKPIICRLFCWMSRQEQWRKQWRPPQNSWRFPD